MSEKKEDLVEWAYNQPYNQGVKGNVAGSERRAAWPGLCGKCDNLQYITTEFGHKMGQCDGFKVYGGQKMTLDPNQPIVECTKFWPKGAMKLIDLAQIAHPVDNREDPNEKTTHKFL